MCILYISCILIVCVCIAVWPYLLRYLKQRKATDPIFVSFTEQIRGAERHTLESLLRLPISRIWEYDKLIEQLIAVTTDDHPDYPNLKEASVKLHAVCFVHHLFCVCVCVCGMCARCVCVHGVCVCAWCVCGMCAQCVCVCVVCVCMHSMYVVWVSCSSDLSGPSIQMVQCREDAIKISENEVLRGSWDRCVWLIALVRLQEVCVKDLVLCLSVCAYRINSFKCSHAFHTISFVSTNQWIFCM